jgi:glycosyltransferase involved in cell wall biosynthesis
MANYTITFATLECLEHTKMCVESLIKSGVEAKRIVAVDNSSSDGTAEYLQQLGLGAAIINRQNLSCGAAWNQGILVHQSDWTIVMNNDVVVTDKFADKLIGFAINNNLKLVSPARVDGSLDYDFSSFAREAELKMAKAVRLGSSNAICMCIHWSLFNEIGFFRANPSLLGFEDGLFYNDLRKKKIRHATTGSVWIHHFGSVTQEHMKMALGKKNNEVLTKVSDRKLYGQSWFERKLYRHSLKKSHRNWRENEIKDHGMTLHGMREKNEFIWI